MSKFWYIPVVFVLLSFMTAILNHANIMQNKPIVASDYSFGFIIAMIVIAVLLEFVYLFVEKMVLE